MTRRNRSDSAKAKQSVVESALDAVEPPAHMEMSDTDRIYFDAIVEEFPRDYWTEHQKQIAVLLSRCMADMDELQLQLRDEGPVAYSAKGMPVPNPLKVVVQMHASTIDKYRRALALNPGEKRDRTGAPGRKQTEDDTRRAVDGDDDNLIAMPNRAAG